MPSFQLYYWVAVLVTVRWWFSQPKQNPAVILEAAILGSYAALSNLVYRGLKAHPAITTLMKMTVRVWQQAGTIYRAESTFSPYTPLWGNPQLKHYYQLPDPELWASKGIVTLKHSLPTGSRSPLLVLRETYAVPASMTFRYYQLKHATQAQFPNPITPGTFFHVVWECPLIRPFWEQVIGALNEFGDWSLGQDPILALLGSMEDVVASRHVKLFLFYALYYARREILLRWKQAAPLTLRSWVATINSVLSLYKLTYESRNCPKKFDKVWS